MTDAASVGTIRRTRLEELLPLYDFSERHGRLVAASPERTYAAIKAVTLGEMPLVRVLFDLRSLPALLARRRALPRAKDEPLLAQLLAFGFTLLAEDPNRELVAGVVGQMFRSGGETAAIRDGAEFAAFGRPGFAKAAMSFLVVRQDGRTRIETETRVLATDQDTRRAFGRYWRVIRPGSGAIRRSWLRAIARRASRADGHDH
jgi:hypothetical protein